jgi:hypothetical protein
MSLRGLAPRAGPNDSAGGWETREGRETHRDDARRWPRIGDDPVCYLFVCPKEGVQVPAKLFSTCRFENVIKARQELPAWGGAGGAVPYDRAGGNEWQGGLIWSRDWAQRQ